MSFRGFTKGVVRAPTLVKKKFNLGTQTEDDPVFVDAERRFKELELETKRLTDEAHKYFKSVNGLLEHQIEFSKGIEEIYKPISGKASDPNQVIPEDSPEGLAASEAYRALVTEMKSSLAPDLALIDDRIIKPAKELTNVIQTVRKMLTKRNRKKLDLDRHNESLAKIENKQEKTPKDEEKLFKAQAAVEVAQQEYDFFNNICIEELPKLFYLEAEFIKPLFVSFYFMQLNIFYTLYTRMEELKIPYFDLNSELYARFAEKRGNVEELVDAIGICHFKTNFAKTKLEMTKRRYGKAEEAQEDAAAGGAAGSSFVPQYSAPPAYAASPVGASPIGVAGAAPVGIAGASTGYASPSNTGYGSPAAAGYGSPAAATAAPAYTGYAAPPSASPAASASPAPYTATTAPSSYSASPSPAETCTALYDYTAQAEGDLTFPAGAVIQILARTPDENGWWTGVYNGQQGIFPGNYVQSN